MKEAAQGLPVHAGTGVGDGHAHAVASLAVPRRAHGDGDAPALWNRVQRIADEVCDNLLDLPGQATHGGRRPEAARQAHIAQFSVRFIEEQHRFNQLFE